MRYHKGCIFVFGVILHASQIYGALEINLPANKVGYYKDNTHLNCTDSPFIFANGYSWSKDSVVVYDTVGGDSTGTGKYSSSHGTGYFTLDISDTDIDDEGEYKCSYNFVDMTDSLEIQAKGSGHGKLHGDKLVITLTEIYPNTTTVSSVICNGKTYTGTEKITFKGKLFDLIWTATSVNKNDVKDGCEVSISSISPYIISVAINQDNTSSTQQPTTQPPTTQPPTTQPPTTLPSTTKSQDKDKDITDIIVGVVVGAIVLLLLIIVIVVCKLRKKTERKKENSGLHNHYNDHRNEEVEMSKK